MLTQAFSTRSLISRQLTRRPHGRSDTGSERCIVLLDQIDTRLDAVEMVDWGMGMEMEMVTATSEAEMVTKISICATEMKR